MKRPNGSLPSWGVNYNFKFREFAIGWHNDIIVENFKVKSNHEDDVILERSYPIASAIVVSV